MSLLADRLRALEAIVGESRLLTSTDGVADYRLDGQQPIGVVRPRTPEQLAAVLKSATEAGFSVLARGEESISTSGPHRSPSESSCSPPTSTRSSSTTPRT